MCFPRKAALLLLSGLLALPAWAAQVSLALGTLRHPAFEAQGVRLAFDAQRRGAADLRIARLHVAGIEYRELQLHCADFHFDGDRLDCPKGELRRTDERGRERPPLPFSMAFRARDRHFELALDGAEVVELSPLVKRLRGWKPTGHVDLKLTMQGDKADLQLALRNVGFRDKAGDIAGANISATVAVHAEHESGNWRWHAALAWPDGNLAWLPWHVPAGVRAQAEGRLDESELDVRHARLEMAGIGAVDASLRWDRVHDEPLAWGFVTERLDLATAMRDAVQPWLAQFRFPSWYASGFARFSAEWREGHLRRFYAGLEDARLSDSTDYLELSGVNARIPWERDRATEADVSVAAGRFGDLPFARFAFPIRLAGRAGEVDHVVAPMLDGRFEIERLRFGNEGGGWHGEFSGGIEDVSMPKLTRALRWPTMAGKLSMRVPSVSYADGVLALDGALGVEVFDGGLIVHRLRVVDPFTARRRFVADVTARNLDLGMLTRTFAFGSIEGRFDADLHGLEMVGLRPVRFDARLHSSEGEYARVVSLGALRDIAALGEGDAGEAVARIPARTFPSFGYERIDIGCKLDNGVCLLDGIAPEDGGVLLMQGRGIPSVRIIGYNRRIDWDALVARIQEKIAGRPGVVIE